MLAMGCFSSSREASRWVGFAASGLVVLATVLACLPPTYMTSQFRVQPGALMAAPAGPPAVGPIPDDGKVALEVTGTASHNETVQAPRSDVVPGHHAATYAGALRFAAGIRGWFEPDGGVGLALGSGAIRSASDMTPDAVAGLAAARGMVGARALIVGSRSEPSFGVAADVSLSSVRFEYTLTSTTTGGVGSGVPIVTHGFGSIPWLSAGAGLFASSSMTAKIGLSGGLRAEVVPHFVGDATWLVQCLPVFVVERRPAPPRARVTFASRPCMLPRCRFALRIPLPFYPRPTSPLRSARSRRPT